MADFTALITLDGSALAEEALSMVPFLELVGLTRIRLVAVREQPDGLLLGPEIQTAHEAASRTLAQYLASKAEELKSPSLSVERVVRTGRAAEQVLEEVEQSSPDLVVIATHGRSGVQRWQLGSVADKIIRSAPCPTLVVGPNVARASLSNFRVKKLLVPLDGSEIAEKALTVASFLAAATGASLDLVQVIHLPNTWAADPLFVQDPSSLLDGLEAGARDYLGKKLPGSNASLMVVRTMAGGGIGLELLRLIREERADLTVMTSHARHGVPRFVLGSVADEVLRGPAPVLIVPADEEVPSRLTDASAAPEG